MKCYFVTGQQSRLRRVETLTLVFFFFLLHHPATGLWSSLIKWLLLHNRLGFVDRRPRLCQQDEGHCWSLQAAKTQAVFLHAGSLPACFGHNAALVGVTSEIMKLGYGKTLASHCRLMCGKSFRRTSRSLWGLEWSQTHRIQCCSLSDFNVFV